MDRYAIKWYLAKVIARETAMVLMLRRREILAATGAIAASAA
jgi:hypothetical protein